MALRRHGAMEVMSFIIDWLEGLVHFITLGMEA